MNEGKFVIDGKEIWPIVKMAKGVMNDVKVDYEKWFKMALSKLEKDSKISIVGSNSIVNDEIIIKEEDNGKLIFDSKD